ncbi:MAG TPA: GNAT family acetyltransferase [Geminicoccaceae bacterium]|nr:GNAT family acetyltransferase [Geminicoccaceae bacterium]
MTTVRPYRPPDLDRVVGLWHACGLTRPWNDPAGDIARCLASREAALLVGCDGAADGPVVATVMVGQDGHRGWLYYLAVAPERRRVGLGRRMVAEAEAWLAARGVPQVMLMVREDNASVVAFYRRQGYGVEPRTILSRWLEGGGPGS